MRLIVLGFLSCLLPLSPAIASDGPWDPSKDGKVECWKPNFEKKSCQAMTTYTWGADGHVTGHSRVYNRHMLRGVLMIADFQAVIEGDRACTTMNKEDTRATTFEVKGQPVSAEDSENYFNQMDNSMRKLYGRKLCVDISPYGNQYIVQIFLDGIPKPGATTRLTWLDPDSGWVLAP